MSTVAKWLDGSRFKMPPCTEVRPGREDIVLDGDPAPPRKGAQLVCAVSPAGFCHISTSSLDISASWTSLIAIFGRLLELMVRPMLQDHSPVCNVGVLWPNGWKHQSATWYGARPWPRRPCVRWGSSSPRGQGYCSPSHFSSPCLLWPNSHPSQQLLSSCYTFLWFWLFTSHISGNDVFVFCFRTFWCFYVRNC